MKSSYAIIIPTRTIDGNEFLDSLLKALAEQTTLPEAVHVVSGDKRQGRAINLGVSKAKSKYIATLDDDSIVDDPKLFAKLLSAMENDDTIGIGGAACEIPQNASEFQKRAMREIPRRFFPVQKETVDSDMVQHPCLLMPRELFIAIGGEDEELIRGLDPLLRKKVRDAGKRVAIIADTWVYHLIPDGFWKVTRMYFRNGRGSRFASKNYPERVYELTDGFDNGTFPENRPASYRAARRLWSLLKSLLTLQWIHLATDIAYLAGILVETLSPSEESAPKVEKVETREIDGFPFKLLEHKVVLTSGE